MLLFLSPHFLKIALLYSGHLRTLEKTQALHKEFMAALAQRHDVRVFCQTWNTLESSTDAWWKKEGEPAAGMADAHSILTKTLAPHAIRISEALPPAEAPVFYAGAAPYPGVLSMFYSAKESYSLYSSYQRQNNWEADVLIKLRYDIVFSYHNLVQKLAGLETDPVNILAYSSRTYHFYGAYSDIIIASSSKNPAFYEAYDRLLDQAFLRSYFSKFKEFIAEVFLSKFIFGGCKAVILNDDLKIIRLSGETLEVTPVQQERVHLQSLKNMNYQFIQKYNDLAEFRKDVYNFLDQLQLSYYKVFYKGRVDFNTVLSALKISLARNSNKPELIEVLNHTINSPGISLLHKMQLKLISKVLSFS